MDGALGKSQGAGKNNGKSKCNGQVENDNEG